MILSTLEFLLRLTRGSTHFCDFGFLVGQWAMRSTSEAALITVLSLRLYLAAISFHASPHRRNAAHSYRSSMAVCLRFRGD